MNNDKLGEKSDTRTDKRIIGDSGEELVCMFLVKQGFTIIERNYLMLKILRVIRISFFSYIVILRFSYYFYFILYNCSMHIN